jgi:Asp-tRNA(Asn)/Glu-tRNA(Gln) amidotransferase A subunit family amidase
VIRNAWSTAAGIRSGELAAVDVISAALARIAELDAGLNAFTVVAAEKALAQAAEVDRGERSGLLAGVPISVKDHIWVRGLPATNGSRSLAAFVAAEDCACVARLVEAGAVIVGKTNNPEFCYRGVTSNELWGETRNPRDPSRTAGGSSGGAAASVASGMVPLAIGTDGGGSIRIPSAFCGTTGLKPTFGLIPKMPGFRGWPTLSVTGPIATDIRDLALAATVMAGPSSSDPLTYPSPSGGYLGALDEPGWAGRRVAFSADLGFAELDPDVRAGFDRTIARIADSGAVLVEAHPAPQDPSPLWDPIALAEGWASEGPLLTACPDLVGADAAAIIQAGQRMSAGEYLDAQEARARYTNIWLSFFRDYDVLLTPSMPVTAFELGRLAPATINGAAVPESYDAWCALALPANLAGLPAVSVPIGPGRCGLPLGLQVMGARWADATVLRAAAAVTACLG